MSDSQNKLSAQEAEERAWAGADELEALIIELNGESGQSDGDRREYLATQFMSLLAETYGIGAPVLATSGTDSD